MIQIVESAGSHVQQMCKDPDKAEPYLGIKTANNLLSLKTLESS